jgi:hypothetical protein
MNKQAQQAGDNSQQLQAAGDINMFGVTAAEVVEITRIEVSRVLDELTLSAKGKAETRIEALSERVIEHFKDKPELFEAFGDPDFQYSLRDAGRSAASNDDDHTEQLLVDLLANRAHEGNSSRARLATSHAIKAADKLSLEALNGLTALWATGSLQPLSEDFASQIASASHTAEVLVGLDLPSDKGWVRDAEVLNLVRVHAGVIMNRTSYKVMLQNKVAVNLVSGIDMEAFSSLVATVISAIPELNNQLTAHPLRSGFVKLSGSNEDELFERLPDHAAESPELQQLIDQNGYGNQDATAIGKLDEVVSSVPSLTALAAWWDGAPPLDFTVVGEVVAFVNSRRHLSFTGAATVGELLQLRSQ